jgi:DNA-binding winged helix-turn-helix (wHTH) protein
MDPPAQPRYSFGPFLLDPVEKVLLRDDEPVLLPPKALETLWALVERHGHILEKAELLNRVWPDTFVEEATLAQNIFTLRKALGDSAEGHQYIETVPKRGYRFVAPTRELADDAQQNKPTAQATAIASRPAQRWVTRVSAAVVILILGATAYLGAAEVLAFAARGARHPGRAAVSKHDGGSAAGIPH